MCSVTLYLFYKPKNELNLEERQPTAADLRNLGDELHARLDYAADILDKLLQDGWSAEQSLYDIVCQRQGLQDEQAVIDRLIALGIDPTDVCIDDFGDEEDEDPEVDMPALNEAVI